MHVQRDTKEDTKETQKRTARAASTLVAMPPAHSNPPLSDGAHVAASSMPTTLSSSLLTRAAASGPLLVHGPFPEVNPLPFQGEAILAETAACEPLWRPFYTLDSATMVYSRNTTEYNYYGGIDLEPRHDPWPEDGARRLLSDGTGVDFKDAAEKHRLVPGETGSLLVGECTAPSS